RIAVEIARTDDLEACRLQGLGDQARIIGGGSERRLVVGAVADHERNALFLLLVLLGGSARHPSRQAGHREQAKREQKKNSGRSHFLLAPWSFGHSHSA